MSALVAHLVTACNQDSYEQLSGSYLAFICPSLAGAWQLLKFLDFFFLYSLLTDIKALIVSDWSYNTSQLKDSGSPRIRYLNDSLNVITKYQLQDDAGDTLQGRGTIYQVSLLIDLLYGTNQRRI